MIKVLSCLAKIAVLMVLAMIFANAPIQAVPASSLPFVENDYGKALADARMRHVPMFVEVWAPW